MRRFNLILFIALLVCSCQEANEGGEVSNTISYSTYLDISEDLRSVEITDLSIEDEKIYLEARDRFDKFVVYERGLYRIVSQSHEQLNISEALYQHFYKLVDLTNNNLKNFSDEGIKVINKQNSKAIKTVKSRSESSGGGGGIDSFMMHWYGFDVYLSQQSMAYIAAGGNAINIICGLIPEPTLATKVVGGACGLAGTLAGLGSILYPNGIVISFTYPFGGACIPYSIRPQ